MGDHGSITSFEGLDVGGAAEVGGGIARQRVNEICRVNLDNDIWKLGQSPPSISPDVCVGS